MSMDERTITIQFLFWQWACWEDRGTSIHTLLPNAVIEPKRAKLVSILGQAQPEERELEGWDVQTIQGAGIGVS